MRCSLMYRRDSGKFWAMNTDIHKHTTWLVEALALNNWGGEELIATTGSSHEGARLESVSVDVQSGAKWLNMQKKQPTADNQPGVVRGRKSHRFGGNFVSCLS